MINTPSAQSIEYKTELLYVQLPIGVIHIYAQIIKYNLSSRIDSFRLERLCTRPPIWDKIHQPLH